LQLDQAALNDPPFAGVLWPVSRLAMTIAGRLAICEKTARVSHEGYRFSSFVYEPSGEADSIPPPVGSAVSILVGNIVAALQLYLISSDLVGKRHARVAQEALSKNDDVCSRSPTPYPTVRPLQIVGRSAGSAANR
jgi:hypothetical protein